MTMGKECIALENPTGELSLEAQKIENKEEKQDAEEYDFVRFLLSDLHGIARCKIITKSAYKSMKKVGPGVAWKIVLLSFDNFFNCEATRVDGKRCTDAKLVAAEDAPEPRHLNWAGCGKYKIGGVMCETIWGIDSLRQQACPRYIARRLCDQLEREHNLKLFHATELEFTLFDGKGDPLFEDGSLYIPQEFAFIEEQMLNLSQSLENAGVPIETLQTEYGPGQIEIVLKPVMGITGADNVFLLRNAVKEIFQKPGEYARSTFMSRPIKDKVGNAAHWNHSLWRIGEDGKKEDAMWDPEQKSGLSKTAQHWLAGILKHAPALSAIMCPTVNCWRRLHVGGGTRDIGTPSQITWGVENRLTMIRVLARGGGGKTYLESRVGGAAMNPYLALAANIAAGMDGIKNKLELPPEGTGVNIYGVLPMTLEDALVELENDKILTEYLSQEFVNWYTNAKRAEMEVVTSLTEKLNGDKFKAEMQFYSKWL